MKNLFSLMLVVFITTGAALAQCTITIPANSDPGLYPADSVLPCIQRTVAYSEVIEFMNFDQVDATAFGFPGITADIDSIRIDTITNIPSGLAPSFDRPSRVYPGNTRGCILLSGTTSAAAGSYTLGFTASVWASVSGFPVPVQTVDSATLASLGLSYVLEVIEPGAPCRGVLPPAFTVSTSGPTTACEGDTVTVYVTTTATIPFGILWSTGSTADSVRVAAGGSVSVTVTDQSSVTNSASHTVTELFPPIADFTFTVANRTVTVTSTSTNSPTNFSWDFGGQSSGSGDTTSYTFAADGTYDIELTATNACGSDDTTYQVTVQGVGISKASDETLLLSVHPNPGKGKVYTSFTSKEQANVGVQVLNLQGQQVFDLTVDAVSGINNVALPLHNLTAGVYFVKVQINGSYAVEKLVIE